MASNHSSVRAEPELHAVQLFDTVETRGEAVAGFVRDGYDTGATVLAVIAPDHWSRVANVLTTTDFPLSSAMASRRVLVHDACAVLPRLMRGNRPDPVLFNSTLGELVRALSGHERPLWIYGELVDLLATEGDFRGAARLEELWNSLAERHSFRLFCGYAAVNFGDPRSNEALRTICRAHSQVRSNPRDLLGSFLVNGATVQHRAPSSMSPRSS